MGDNDGFDGRRIRLNKRDGRRMAGRNGRRPQRDDRCERDWWPMMLLWEWDGDGVWMAWTSVGERLGW